MGVFKNSVGRPSNDVIKKRNVFKGICFVFLLIIIGLVIYILNDKKIINLSNKNEKSSSVITLKESKKFLNELVSSSVSDDLLISNSNEDIFINCIKHLVLKKQYIKNDYYIFKQEDIKDLARKYYMKDNYEYISTDGNFEYDSYAKTYSSGLEFGLFSSGPTFKKTRKVKDFYYGSGVAKLTYQVKIVYDKSQFENANDNVSVNSYHIKLIKKGGELRIKSISLVK